MYEEGDAVSLVTMHYCAPKCVFLNCSKYNIHVNKHGDMIINLTSWKTDLFTCILHTQRHTRIVFT